MKLWGLIIGCLIGTRASASPLSFPSDFCVTPLHDSAVYEDLKAKIETCAIGSIDSLIPLLPNAHREHYVLMHHSQSLQQSSFESPRAILFGKDAKLILAFNGDPKQFHYSDLEILQYRDATKTFEARAISFKDKTVFSEANPKMCLSCHHADPRPNWESYPLWPGAYGGEDDDFYRAPKGSGIKTTDGEAYELFLSHAKSQGRYRDLSALPKDTLPNTQLGSLLQGLNQNRIARKINEFTPLKPFHYAVVAASACLYSSLPLEAFLPSAVVSHFKKSLTEFRTETTKINADEFLGRIDQLKKISSSAPETTRIEELLENLQNSEVGQGQVSDQRVANLRYIVENMGMTTEDWSLQPNSKAYDFENGYVGIYELRKSLSRILLTAPSDARLVTRLNSESLSDSELEGVCLQLKTESLNALKTYPNASP